MGQSSMDSPCAPKVAGTKRSPTASCSLLDQIIYRFSKLQDAVGERLAPATLETQGESIDDWPMHDRLHSLERLSYLDAK